MRNKFLHFFAACYAFVLFSCGASDHAKGGEGVIEYEASIVDKENPMSSFAPDKMTLTFKDGKLRADMNAGMGMFSASFISEPSSKSSLTSVVKLLNKKVFLVQSSDDLEKENALCPIELVKSNETKMIAGYPCKKVHVIMKNQEQTEFDVFYTDALNIDKPNFATPFHKIDGVLMEYQLTKFGMEMKFTAQNVIQKEIDSNTFDVPPDYKLISSEEMNSLFQVFQ